MTDTVKGAGVLFPDVGALRAALDPYFGLPKS
jgi:hypothetical protein